MVAFRDGPWPVVGLGVAFTALFVGHVLFSEPIGLEWLFSAYTLLAALLLTAGGLWVYRQDWPRADVRHVVRWTGIGLGALFVLAAVTLADGIVGGDPAPDPVFLTLHLSVMGSLGGLVTGVYNARFRRQSREHAAAENRFRDLLETAPVPVVAVALDGTVEFWNPAAERSFGWSAEAVIDEPYPLLPPGHDPTDTQHLAAIADGDRIEGRTVSRQHRDGGLREVELWGAPLRDADGTPDAALLVLVDITDQHRRDQQLAVLRRVLRHNLRNDLTVIMGLADEIASDAEDPAVRSDAGAVRERSEHLADISHRITRVSSRSERVEALDLVPRVETVCADLRSEFPEATIETSLPPTATVSAVTTIDEALAEAIESAVVHGTAAPAVTVTVECEDDDFVHVRVRDERGDVPRHEWEAVQAGTETPLQHATGVGPWIVRWLVAASGGEVHLVDREGRTELDIQLPATPPIASGATDERDRVDRNGADVRDAHRRNSDAPDGRTT
ncbi:MAG: PAS domain S-box protein [Haloarculaceae archaeon]